MRIKPNKRLVGLLVFGLALLWLGFGTLVSFQRQALADAMTVLAEREQQMHDGQRAVKLGEQARALLEEDRAQLAFLETGVSDAAYVPTLLRQLEDVAARTGNRVLSVRPISGTTRGPSRLEQRRNPDAQDKTNSQSGSASAKSEKDDSEAKKPYNELRIRVNVVGDYRSVQEFIAELQRFPKIMSVQNLQLRPGGLQQPGAGEPRGQRLEAELRLTAYIMKQEVSQQPSRRVALAGEPGRAE